MAGESGHGRTSRSAHRHLRWLPDGDSFVRATSVASAIEGLYEHQAWLVKQIFPDTADSEYLALHAQVRGLRYKPAKAAAGKVAMRGVAGSPIASGLVFKLGDAASCFRNPLDTKERMSTDTSIRRYPQSGSFAVRVLAYAPEVRSSRDLSFASRACTRLERLRYRRAHISL